MLLYEIQAGEKAPVKPLWKRLHWRYTAAQLGLPIFVAFQVRSVPFLWETRVWMLFLSLVTGLSITAGYHRLWTHRSYRAKLSLRIILAVLGTGALQLPIRTWARDHRAHHRYVDTARDPYNSRRGLFYSHLGWILTYDSQNFGQGINLSDLDADPVVRWQRRLYYPLAGVMGFLFPAAVAGFLWDDWRGGFVYAGCLRIVVVWHVTYCINSLAHWGGTRPYGEGVSGRDNPVLGLVTLGEGYHNFHHVFPGDYRNGVQWCDLDVTKWWIWVWEKLGLAQDLKRVSGKEIKQQCARRRFPKSIPE